MGRRRGVRREEKGIRLMIQADDVVADCEFISQFGRGVLQNDHDVPTNVPVAFQFYL
jgi:hypothetical protein